MREIIQIRDGSGRYRLRIDPANYHHDDTLAPLSTFRRVVSAVDDTKPISVDALRLSRCFSGLRSKDFKYYFYIVGKLEENELPVFINLREACNYCGDRTASIGTDAINRLIKEGLLFRVPHKRGEYLINPTYAWRGDRMQYLDTESFMLVD